MLGHVQLTGRHFFFFFSDFFYVDLISLNDFWLFQIFNKYYEKNSLVEKYFLQLFSIFAFMRIHMWIFGDTQAVM